MLLCGLAVSLFVSITFVWHLCEIWIPYLAGILEVRLSICTEHQGINTLFVCLSTYEAAFNILINALIFS